MLLSAPFQIFGPKLIFPSFPHTVLVHCSLKGKQNGEKKTRAYLVTLLSIHFRLGDDLQLSFPAPVFNP
jgi:hypothetical protein